jgi:predicted dehydrogenase
MHAPSVLLVAVNGYGSNYVKTLLELRDQGRASVAGVVDPTASRCERLADLTADGAPVCGTLGEFFAAGHTADCACVASPIGLHAEQTCELLAHGLPVLCEKPLAGSLADADRMAEAERRSGAFVGIGYQWSFSPVMRRLKADILAGRFGAPVRLRTRVLWGRTFRYFARNSWAGKLRDAQGRWVQDSPVNNATAHYLHNMLFVLGDRMDTAAEPAHIDAELHRANDIETFDTCSLRVRTVSGAELLFHTSHTVDRNVGPEFEYVFEKGVVRCFHDAKTGTDDIRAEFRDGTSEHYGNPLEVYMQKMFDFLDKVRDPSLPLVCGIHTARPHLQCVEALRALPVTVHPATECRIDTRPDGDRIVVVPGMFETLMRAYDEWKLPNER